MEYFQIADMFGRRRRPKLELYLEEGEVYSKDASRIPFRNFIIGIRNSGCALARFPSLRFRATNGVNVDPYGIDGEGGFGLPQVPSDAEWVIFGGGADHVVHPGTLMKVAKLEQRAEPSGWQRAGGQTVLQFRRVNLDVELAADEFPNTMSSTTLDQRDVG
jgi:hypothetical protein